MTSRRLFLAVFGLLAVVVGAQNLGTPRNAGPDEPAHVVRAAGLVRGEVFGTGLDELSAAELAELDGGAADIANADPSNSSLGLFDVPAWVRGPSEECFAMTGATGDAANYGVFPASCARHMPPADTLSSAATYPVWSHLLPGAATLLVHNDGALWLARLFHGLVPLLLVAAALTRLLTAARIAAASAVLVALTPMTLFMFAVVNPSGVAIAGALALWVALDDVLARRAAPDWLLPAAFAALVLPRDDGVLWAALIVGVLLAVHRTAPLAAWRLLSLPARAVVAATTAASALWALLAGGELVPVDRPATGIEFAEIVVQRTGRHLREAIGVLGWLDTELPESVLYLWCLAAGLVVMIALAARQQRRALGAAAALGLGIVAGWVLEIVQGRTAGLFWQGRYALPVLAGLVLLPGLSRGADRAVGRLGAFVPGVVAVVVWNGAFLQALRRWGVGRHGSVRPWAWDTYGAPMPVLLLIAAHVAASAGLGYLVWRCAAGGSDDDTTPPLGLSPIRGGG